MQLPSAYPGLDKRGADSLFGGAIPSGTYRRHQTGMSILDTIKAAPRKLLFQQFLHVGSLPAGARIVAFFPPPWKVHSRDPAQRISL
jgi:hypothetical protein